MDFSQVAAEFRTLKAQYDAGALSEADFKARLQELMLQDEQGRWWMIGYETGQWYVHDGEKWVQSEPPPIAEQRRKQMEALCQEGKTTLAAGDWAAAIEKFEAALALEPDHAEATKGLAEAKARAVEASRPDVPVQPMTAPTAPVRRRWVWVVAGVIGVIGLILVIVFLRSCTIPSPGPQGQLWVDRDAIKPGECTVLYWDVPGAKQVRLVGPGFDPQILMPGNGQRDACPGETAAYELQNPDRQIIATVVIQVRK